MKSAPLRSLKYSVLHLHPSRKIKISISLKFRVENLENLNTMLTWRQKMFGIRGTWKAKECSVTRVHMHTHTYTKAHKRGLNHEHPNLLLYISCPESDVHKEPDGGFVHLKTTPPSSPVVP